MNHKIRKIAEQLENEYYPLGQKGEEYGGNAEQDNEAAEELNEELEARDMENYTPGTDNLVIDKNEMNDTGMILAELKRLAILWKKGYAKSLLDVVIGKIEQERRK